MGLRPRGHALHPLDAQGLIRSRAMHNPVIMIAGPSASGKSTLAHSVAEHFKFPCVSLDDLYIRGSKAFVETPRGPVQTYERPELYDGDRLAGLIRNRTSGLVVEGFCLFTYPRLLSIADWRFYLDVPFPICARRRHSRQPQRHSDRSYAVHVRGSRKRPDRPSPASPAQYPHPERAPTNRRTCRIHPRRSRHTYSPLNP